MLRSPGEAGGPGALGSHLVSVSAQRGDGQEKEVTIYGAVDPVPTLVGRLGLLTSEPSPGDAVSLWAQIWCEYRGGAALRAGVFQP